MVFAPTPYRFSLDGFVRAWEAGAFESRVELVEGEVLPVVIGDWHGETQMRIARALPNDQAQVTGASLPSGASLPDPDCWVLRVGAQPAARLSARLSVWSPDDVLLVIEVGDETLDFDLSVKASMYGRAGFPCYWVVSHQGIHEHTGPHQLGYTSRHLYSPGEQIPVNYAGTELRVSDLLAPDLINP